MNQNQIIAETIVKQLGGNHFIVMTGSKNFVYGESNLSFKVGSGTKNGITHVRITLTPDDLYDMEFLKIRGMKEPVTVAKHEDIYCDMLQDIFTSETGFYTSL